MPSSDEWPWMTICKEVAVDNGKWFLEYYAQDRKSERTKIDRDKLIDRGGYIDSVEIY